MTVRKTVLDVGIDFPKGGKDHALEFKALGDKDLRALKRTIIDDRLLFTFERSFTSVLAETISPSSTGSKVRSFVSVDTKYWSFRLSGECLT